VIVRRGAVVAAAAALAGCAGLRGGGAAACRPVRGPLPASASTAAMRGQFAFTMVATAGAKAGSTAVGRLWLEPQDSTLQSVERARQPLRGTADIALEDVGAARMGDLGARDPTAPGIAVYEQRPSGAGAPTVVVRLGSGSNARGPSAFDAAHTTLYVHRIGRDGFAGGWASNAGSAFPPRGAEGYFCAVRSGP
jgi:hypothetical protein